MIVRLSHGLSLNWQQPKHARLGPPGTWSVSLLCAILLLASTSVSASRWSKHLLTAERDDRSLCQEMLDWLRKAPQQCWSRDVVQAFPGFVDPPWQDVDPKEHVDLLAKLEKFASEGGAYGYKGEIRNIPDGFFVSSVEAEIKQGLSFRIWKTRLLSYFDDGRRFPAHDEALTLASVLELGARSEHVAECPTSNAQGAPRFTYAVTADLRDPDLRVDALRPEMVPMLYKGRTILFDLKPQLYRDDPDFGLRAICYFTLDP
ncbi:MAG: hypothetical protein U1F30_13510 [Steroidobacteraceae bacterium]